MKGQMNQWNKSAVGCFIRLLLVVAYVLGLALVPLPVGAATAQPLDEAPSWADELTFTLVNDPLAPVTGPSPQREALAPLNAGGDQVTLLGFHIKYLGTTSNGDGTYTWTYIVSATSVVTKALSYWTLGLCQPARDTVSPGDGGTYVTVPSYDGYSGRSPITYTVGVGKDPNTGITGIKYDFTKNFHRMVLII